MSVERNVRISARAERAIEESGDQLLERLKEGIRELASNPLSGKKLKGEFEGLRSYRVGSYRIVYRFDRDVLEVIYIDHRKDVYR